MTKINYGPRFSGGFRERIGFDPGFHRSSDPKERRFWAYFHLRKKALHDPKARAHLIGMAQRSVALMHEGTAKKVANEAPHKVPKGLMRVARNHPDTGERHVLDLPITKKQIDHWNKVKDLKHSPIFSFTDLEPWQIEFYLTGRV